MSIKVIPIPADQRSLEAVEPGKVSARKRLITTIIAVNAVKLMGNSVRSLPPCSLGRWLQQPVARWGE